MCAHTHPDVFSVSILMCSDCSQKGTYKNIDESESGKLNIVVDHSTSCPSYNIKGQMLPQKNSIKSIHKNTSIA